MRVTVVGAGAVGGYFGGRLMEAGVDVQFLVREGRKRQLGQTGLVIESTRGNAHLDPNLAAEEQELQNSDVVLLCVKNYHLPNIIPKIRGLVESGAKVLPLLNGVQHYDLLRTEFGDDAVIGGLCQIITTLDEQGRVVHSGGLQTVTFGPLKPEQSDFCARLMQSLASVNSDWQLSRNILSDIWAKYIFITSFSGVTTASRCTIAEIMAVDATKRVFRNALEEMYTLSLNLGISQPASMADLILQRVSKQPEGATSSMHQDLRKGLPLEVESLQGAAVRKGAEVGLRMPTIETLYGLIKPFELPR